MSTCRIFTLVRVTAREESKVRYHQSALTVKNPKIKVFNIADKYVFFVSTVNAVVIKTIKT